MIVTSEIVRLANSRSGCAPAAGGSAAGLLGLQHGDSVFVEAIFPLLASTCTSTFEMPVCWAQAMPAIAERHPDALYLVVGATHPNLLRHDGDAYFGCREIWHPHLRMRSMSPMPPPS